MSLSIQEQDVHSIKERLRKEHQQRLKDIIAKHKKKLEENILCTTEHHKNNINKLTEQLDYETVRVLGSYFTEQVSGAE